MKELMGVINLDHELDKLNELTYFRCGAAVPFASRYRLIDFVLSNMMRAELESVGLFVRRKYRSLMDHLGDGKSWDMNRKHGGCSSCLLTGTIRLIHQSAICSITITTSTFSKEHPPSTLFSRAASILIRLICRTLSSIIWKKEPMSRLSTRRPTSFSLSMTLVCGLN